MHNQEYSFVTTYTLTVKILGVHKSTTFAQLNMIMFAYDRN